MNAMPRGRLLLLGATAVIVIASCSGDSTTTTEDPHFRITYSSPGLDTGEFDGVICDGNGRFRGEDGAGSAIEIDVALSAGNGGTVRIRDEFLQVDLPVTDVEDTEVALEVFAKGPLPDPTPVQVSVVYSEWDECSADAIPTISSGR